MDIESTVSNLLCGYVKFNNSKIDKSDTRVFRIIWDYIFIPLFRPSLEKNFCLQTEATFIIIFHLGYNRYNWYFNIGLTFGFNCFGSSIVVMKIFCELVTFHRQTRVARTNSTSFAIPGLFQRGRWTNWPIQNHTLHLASACVMLFSMFFRYELPFVS